MIAFGVFGQPDAGGQSRAVGHRNPQVFDFADGSGEVDAGGHGGIIGESEGEGEKGSRGAGEKRLMETVPFDGKIDLRCMAERFTKAGMGGPFSGIG